MLQGHEANSGEGRMRTRTVGNVAISQEAFLAILDPED